jgi:hypothetical protein
VFASHVGITPTPTPSPQDAYLLADECLKVRVASIKKEDDNLQKEKDRLDQEKVSPYAITAAFSCENHNPVRPHQTRYMREMKRIRDEDSSRIQHVRASVVAPLPLFVASETHTHTGSAAPHSTPCWATDTCCTVCWAGAASARCTRCAVLVLSPHPRRHC